METTIDLPPPNTGLQPISPTTTPTKARSFSDPPNVNTPNALAPSPTFHERPKSQDDHAVPTTPPTASRRPDFLARGLSLQMPSPSHFPSSRPALAVPLSPQLDPHNIYMQQSQTGSPATSLPRHSRGLDFSRACSTLHHSTLAESSPDSSPLITQRGVMIPPRKGSVSSMMLDSPNINGPGSVPWGSLAPERSAVSSSVGSVNMMASESESSGSDEDASMAGDDNEDPIFTTPQVHKLHNPSAPTPFAAPPTTPGGAATATWGNGSNFSPAQASLMKTMRRRGLHKHGKRTRKSSSSASGSGYSSMASPRTTSPPPMRSIESATNGGYFNWPTAARSRRESLALGTDGLHLSSGNDSGDEASSGNPPSTPGVVRRPVTARRGNLLPKTKGFARIRAALLEEAAPVDSEFRREAETIRQVRERDGSATELDFTPDSSRPQTATGQSSPSLLPAVPESAQEDFGRELDSEPASSQAKGLGMNFAMHANRNSHGTGYWNRFEQHTPPPPGVNHLRHQSSGVMSDINMDSSEFGTPNNPLWRRPRARSSASDASEALVPPSQPQLSAVNDDMHLKKFKRRREDDFDIATIKRRAVSPGMSAQNSPVLTHSPSQKEANANWGQPPERKSQSSYSSQGQPQSTEQSLSRHGSGGSSVSLASGATLAPSLSGGGGKKLGLQGMVDTNEGLLKMSIE